jgi:hypothetical protein
MFIYVTSPTQPRRLYRITQAARAHCAAAAAPLAVHCIASILNQYLFK